VDAPTAARFEPARLNFRGPGYDRDHPCPSTTEGSSDMQFGNVETLHNDGQWHNVIEGTDR
jgi:hypothetical protein